MHKVRRQTITGLALAVGGFALLLGSGWVFLGRTGGDELPVVEAAPGFRLTDQDGQAVALSDFRGKVKVLSFFYTRCAMPSMCPLLARKFKKLQDGLGPLAHRTVLLMVSFDPAHDDPATLREYGELHGADFANWHLLTGPPEQVQSVCEQYAITHKKREDGTFRHSMLLYLIDTQDRIRKIHAGNQWTVSEVRKEIARLAPARAGK